MNVKRAAAAVAGALGALLLAAVIGLGHVAGPPASTPAQATLAAHIYGDSVNVSGSHSWGRPSWGDTGSSSSSSSAGSSNYGDGTAGITADNYGD